MHSNFSSSNQRQPTPTSSSKKQVLLKVLKTVTLFYKLVLLEASVKPAYTTTSMKQPLV